MLVHESDAVTQAAPYSLVPVAEVTRGDCVESIHAGTIVVADAHGRLVASAGAPDTFAYFRSSAKPFQAIPVIESGAADGFGFTPAELALCCASHHAEPSHQRQVAAMLKKIGLSPQHLQCGIPLPSNQAEAARVTTGEVAPSPLQCDCSGKHAGMLAVCMHEGYDVATYLKNEHPLQIQILRIIGEVLRVPVDAIAPAKDGCSLPTFGSSVATFARSYATLADPKGSDSLHQKALDRLRSAMMAHPENVSGSGSFVTDLMALASGRIVAKTGAEGLICIGIPEASLGIAIRIADGSFRVHPEVVIETLRQLGLMDDVFFATLSERHPPIVRNHNGWAVGEYRPVFSLETTVSG
jgi:L-asparaginase II